MANSTQRILENFEFKPPIPRGQRLEPWSDAWFRAISPTGAQTTHWHLDKFRGSLGDWNFSDLKTMQKLDDWIIEGAERTTNYIAPRLKIASEILYYTKGCRYEWYYRFRKRFLKRVSNEIEAR